MDLTEITALARRQVELEREVEEKEAALRDAKARLQRVAMEDLPLAMTEVGLQKITLESGEMIEIKLDFTVGIPEAKRDEAFDWLEKRKFGGLVKTVVAVQFGKGELEKAKKLLGVLAGKNLPATLKREVHWQTLKAWVKEQTCAEKPLAIPPDLFGNSSFNKAVVHDPKGRKA